jgi:hypothetical protein
MNFELAFLILQLAVTLLHSHAQSNEASQAEIADTLKEIVAVALRAYHDHFGVPLDPFSIQVEDPI